VIAVIVLIDRDEGNSRLLLRERAVDFHYMMSASDDDLRRIRARPLVGSMQIEEANLDRLSIAEEAAWIGARAIHKGWRPEGLMDLISKTATADVSTRLDACSDRVIKG